MSQQFLQSPEKKQRLTGFIPYTLFKHLFIEMLPQRGAQIYVISELILAFYLELVRRGKANPEISFYEHAKTILTNITFENEQ